jgi:hypothetical protein
MSQRSRRHDPYPWTCEVPMGVILVILLVLVCGVHLGRAIADVLGGAGWSFPRLVDLFSSLPGILRGGHFPSPMTFWVCVLTTELLLIAVCVFVLKQVLDYWGPARMKGMASSVEAERLLGITRLRKNRAVIRPDLYGKRRNPA